MENDREFPRVYRIERGQRRFLMVLALLIALAAGIGFVVISLDDDPWQIATLSVVFAPFFLLGGLGAISFHRTRVLLYEDAIELQGLIRRRRLLRADISGQRGWRGHGSPRIKLCTSNAAAKGFTLPQLLENDDVWHRWMSSIPDLDANERQASEDEYLGEALFNKDWRQEKLARLSVAKRVVKWMNAATLIVSLWVWLYPRPYFLAVGLLCALPWVTMLIAMRGKGAYSLDGRENEIRPTLALALYSPGVALALRATEDGNVFDRQVMLWLVVAATAACALVLLACVKELRRTKPGMVLVPLLMSVYCFGAAGVANMRFDTSVGELFAVRVLDKRVHSGKSTTYHLNLAPWGPRTEQAEEAVQRDLYDQLRIGDQVCVSLKAGAFKVRLYEVGRCVATPR